MFSLRIREISQGLVLRLSLDPYRCCRLGSNVSVAFTLAVSVLLILVYGDLQFYHYRKYALLKFFLYCVLFSFFPKARKDASVTCLNGNCVSAPKL